MSVKPALTPEEWARFPDIAGGSPEPGEEPLYHHTRHGIAATNLYGHPRGFRRYDVKLLRWARTRLCALTDAPDDWVDLTHLADRIEALLPPEGA